MWNRGLCRPAGAKSPGANPATSASIAGRLFFPQSKDLGCDVKALVSPGILKKMVYSGTHATSFAQASRDLKELAEVEISSARIRRMTERIGQERVDERNDAVAHWQQQTIPAQQRSPLKHVPEAEVVCVQMDGGRLQVWDREHEDDQLEADDQSKPDRQSEADEQSESDGSSSKTFWRESKVGICLSMTSKVSEQDPCPTIPKTFVNPARMSRLAREIKNAGKKPEGTSGPNARQAKKENQQLEAALETIEEEKQEAFRYKAPKIAERTVVATRQDVTVFGPLLAAKAWALGFAAVCRKAFVGDGSDTNWSVWRKYFSHYTPILDFVHAICYVYQAAVAALLPEEAWQTYCQWAQWVWSGQVHLVIEAMEARQQELGQPEADDPDSHPRRILATAIGYLRNQKGRMKYAHYRKNGLPITSSHIESTIKQINRRVKGTEKFWHQGAEPILQLAADHLSQTNALDQFWKTRQHRLPSTRRYQPTPTLA